MKMVEYSFFTTIFCYILANPNGIEKLDSSWQKFLTAFNSIKSLQWKVKYNDETIKI